MNTLYIECSMGAAGDMLMAALLELCPEPEAFIEKMNSLGLPGVHVSYEERRNKGMRGTKVSVRVFGQEECSPEINEHGKCAHREHCHHHHHEHEHEHEHHHHHGDHDHDHDHGHHHHHHEHSHSHVTLADIDGIIRNLDLPEKVKEDALSVYSTLAAAECRVHGSDLSQLHFHEVGTLDAVADVVGVCLLINMLNPAKITASPITVGFGSVNTSHGLLPVPAPATSELLRGIPITAGSVEGELCTPTGAALLKHFVSEFRAMPAVTIDKIGVGLGTKEFSRPNCLRAFLCGEESDQGRIMELTCNVDDMTGEAMGFAIEVFMASGALDAFAVPAVMKKGRPGYVITCLCAEDKARYMAELMLKHTTSLGVRMSLKDRMVLNREIIPVDTVYGPLRVKIATGNGVVKAKPEYEDAATLARDMNVPIDDVCKAAIEAWLAE